MLSGVYYEYKPEASLYSMTVRSVPITTFCRVYYNGYWAINSHFGRFYTVIST